MTSLADQLTARALARADSFDNGPPRRPRNGHSADCPDWLQPNARRCPNCRAERLAAPDRPAPRPTDPQPEHHAGQLVACRQCFAPTDHHTGLCGRCRPEETDHA